MFGKLLKYDFKAIGRTQLPVLFALLCTTVLGCLNAGVFCISAEYGNEFLALFSGFGFLFTMLGFVSIFTLMYFLIFIRFYKSTATNEAYTTFTLPAYPSQILGAKFLSAIFWTVISTAAYLLAIFLTVLTMLLCIGNISELPQGFGYVLDALVNQLQMSAGDVILFLLSAVISSLSQILQIFTAILIGSSLVRHYKALAAVGMYFAVTFIVSTLGSVFSFSFTGSLFSAGTEVQFSRIFSTSLLSQGVLYAVVGIACWIISVNIMKNRINLE